MVRRIYPGHQQVHVGKPNGTVYGTNQQTQTTPHHRSCQKDRMRPTQQISTREHQNDTTAHHHQPQADWSSDTQYGWFVPKMAQAKTQYGTDCLCSMGNSAPQLCRPLDVSP